MKLRDLLELARVSNLPTVWSNAVLGVYAGYEVVKRSFDPEQRPALDRIVDAGTFEVAVVAAVAMSTIYSAGMVMNDLVDRKIDAQERPSRPIPSGRVSPATARTWVLCLFGLGVVLVGAFDTPATLFNQQLALASAILLVVLVAAYNMVHQRSPAAVLLMAACRSAVVFCCAFLGAPGVRLLQHPSAWLFVCLPAASLFFYTLAISIVARHEVEHDRAAQPRRFGFLPSWFGGPKVIMNMIAAMPLLDAVWLLVMGLWPASLFCIACAGLTKWGHRRVAGS